MSDGRQQCLLLKTMKNNARLIETVKPDRESQTQSIPSLDEARFEKEAVKAEYVECLAATHDNITSLRQAIQRALAIHITWKELIQWGTQAGYHDKYIRKLLSGILLDSGIRRRKRGAGPETPQAALALLAYARDQHGDSLAEKLLLAAWRACKSQRLARRQQQATISKALNN